MQRYIINVLLDSFFSILASNVAPKLTYVFGFIITSPPLRVTLQLLIITSPVGNQRAVAVVQVLGAVGSLVLERARGIIVSRRLRHARQPVAAVSYYVVNSAKIHLHINNSK